MRKLRLRAGESLLDIGCGWGTLSRAAAWRCGVRAHGITLSEKQYEHGRCRIERKDYRDLVGEAVFDKIISVGMFEHVGIYQILACKKGAGPSPVPLTWRDLYC